MWQNGALGLQTLQPLERSAGDCKRKWKSILSNSGIGPQFRPWKWIGSIGKCLIPCVRWTRIYHGSKGSRPHYNKFIRHLIQCCPEQGIEYTYEASDSHVLDATPGMPCHLILMNLQYIKSHASVYETDTMVGD